MRFFIFMAVFICIAQFSFLGLAKANESILNNRNALFLPNIYHNSISKYDLKNMDLESPPEPYFKKVKFLKQQPPNSLTERVDRLIHGTKIDVPTEYDHYGHEIRRYMSDLLTPEDLDDPEKLSQKIQNAKKARIILDYWRKAISEEKSLIEDEISKDGVPPTIITSFRYNAGIVDQFIADAYVWIDRNLEFLEFLQKNKGEYNVQYPFYVIESHSLRSKFEKLYNSRQAGLERIIDYSPFRAMIY